MGITGNGLVTSSVILFIVNIPIRSVNNKSFYWKENGALT